jgi:hypothetical protein
MSVYAIAKREVNALDSSTQAQPEAAATRDAVATDVLARSVPGPMVSPAPVGTSGIGMALGAIGTYIPTEVMATYLAVLAAIPAGRGHSFQWLMFWAFLGATPIVVWLGVAVARQSQGIVVKPAKQWPWWSMIAATVAFGAFVLVLPGSVTRDVSWYESWMGSIAIILSAFILGLGDQLFGTRTTPARSA